jgi:endonuclease-3
MAASKRKESGPRKPAAKPTKPTKSGKTTKPSQPAKPIPPSKPAKEVAAVPAKPPAVKPPPRGQLLPRLFKALKATYKAVPTDTSRPLLDQVLYACCLENARPEVAEKALARLRGQSFDLNEVRVTTVAELAEALHDLPDPAHAALSLRRVLQSVFESTYSFSLEHAKKHSLAHGLKVLENLHGVPPFVIQHVVSTTLGGHVIPLDHGALAGLYLAGLITQAEYDSGKVPGLERLIPKKSGVEFSSLLHQFGVDCLSNLHGATVKKVVAAVNPAAKDRFPKRGEPLPAPNPPPPPPGRESQRAAEAARAVAEEHRPAGPQAAARPAGKTPLPPPGSGPKRPGDKAGTGKPGPKPFVVKPNVGKPITIKPPVAETPATKPAPAAKKPEPAKKPIPKHSAQLVKRKPR